MKVFQILLIIAVVAVPTTLGFSPSVGRHRHVVTKTTNKNLSHQSCHDSFITTTTTTLRMAEDNNNNDITSPKYTTIPTKQIKTVPDGAVGDSFSFDQVQDFLNSIDLTALNLDTIRNNAMEGEFGTRGEGYFAVQVVLISCIVLGGVPLIGNTLSLLLGPGLLLAGLSVLVLGTLDLGDSLSPWPKPVSKTTGLKTTGIYAQMRHPMYAGLLAAAAGLSIVTGSANRLLLTAILFYALDVKSKFEEDALIERFPVDYVRYQQDVPGKFFPSAILSELPWSKQNKDMEDK